MSLKKNRLALRGDLREGLKGNWACRYSFSGSKYTEFRLKVDEDGEPTFKLETGRKDTHIRDSYGVDVKSIKAKDVSAVEEVQDKTDDLTTTITLKHKDGTDGDITFNVTQAGWANENMPTVRGDNTNFKEQIELAVASI